MATAGNVNREPGADGGDDEASFMSTAEDLIKEELEYKSLSRVQQVHGGIINKAAIYDTNRGQIFVKYAQRSNAKGMFDSEMAGLLAMRASQTIRVPEPIRVLSHPDGGAVFVMECLANLKQMNRHWADLGNKFSRMHAHNPSLLRKEEEQEHSVHRPSAAEPVRKFGFHLPTYMGHKFQTVPVWCDTWQEYWIPHILKPQFDEIEQTGDKELSELWSELQLHIDKVFRGLVIRPSLLHGDFCTINVGELADEAVIFDPTSFYGHHEDDFTILNMAMEEDFPDTFHKEYHRLIPREKKGYDLRKQAYQLSAYALCYHSGYESELMRKLALETGKALLKSLLGN